MDEQLPADRDAEEELAKAYRVYQDNIRRVDELVYRITKGAREGMPEKELLELVREALARCRTEPEK